MGTLTHRLIAIIPLLLMSCCALAVRAEASTFNVIYTFTGGSDGGNPVAGLTLDRAGNLYGTTPAGGTGYGTAFELKRARRGWTFDVLYAFSSGADGAAPGARLIPGPNGHLFGTTTQGGTGGGTVFELSGSAKSGFDAATSGLSFAKSGLSFAKNGFGYAKSHFRKVRTIFTFSGSNGYQPSNGDIAFDAAGNLYGTTSYGGANNLGAVYKLTPAKGGWAETILHSFGTGTDGSIPVAGVMFDAAGNLYGATSAGGATGNGIVYQLQSGPSGWKENVLWNFQAQADGQIPYAGLTLDQNGNLYGGATEGGTNSGGTIFELSPSPSGWRFNTVYSTPGWGISGPFRTPFVDSNGNVFGTTHCDGLYSAGSVYELTYSNGTWNYTSLYDFTGGSDGGYVFANPVFDSHGDIFGTTQVGGAGYGVVWEISP